MSEELCAITVCVGFDDYLGRIVDANKDKFDEWIIITTEEDIKTREVCDKHGLTVFTTDAFNQRGRIQKGQTKFFNKGAAIDELIKILPKDKWCLHIDADIIIPFEIKPLLDDLDEEELYGCYRVNNGVVDNNPMDIGVGFFQLFHLSSEKAQGYPRHYAHAGRSDRNFMRRWAGRGKICKKLNHNVIHIAQSELGENWCGRVTPREGNDLDHQDVDDSKYKGGPIYVHDGYKQIPVNLQGIYSGCACFLLCSGPSLANMDLGLLDKAGFLTMGVNNSPKIYRPNMQISVDSAARFLESVWRDPKIMKFAGIGKPMHRIWDHQKWFLDGCPENNDYYSETTVGECPNVYYFVRNNKFNADTFLTERTVNWGNNAQFGGGRSVMVAAIKILYILGIRRLYLLGTDFSMVGDKPYGFEEQRTRNAVRNNNVGYHKMMSYFTQLAPYFKEAGFTIHQCTPKTALTIFPYMSLEEAIDRETARLPDPTTECSYGMYIPNR
jgi:hypothetical protein